MKRTVLICFLLLSIKATHGQITLDTVLVPWDGFGFSFYPVQISSSETKYLNTDTITNTFSLYNMDFSPFILNIAVPEPLIVQGAYIYDVIYVTRALFDCDTSNIEYAYAPQGSISTKSFYIMRTDGTQLFKLDSARAPYCYGCNDGSIDIKPIGMTSAGAKLYLNRAYEYNGQTTYIYSLCGTLPQGNFELYDAIKHPFVNVFPNPTSNSITFQIFPPDNMKDYQLVIIDSNVKEMARHLIESRNDKFAIDLSRFNNGIYFYSLCTKNRVIQSGKFVVNR